MTKHDTPNQACLCNGCVAEEPDARFNPAYYLAGRRKWAGRGRRLAFRKSLFGSMCARECRKKTRWGWKPVRVEVNWDESFTTIGFDAQARVGAYRF